jgi:hypothetical protein
MKPAMITIEVLISMLILFLVISTSMNNINFFNLMIEKKQSYEDKYMTVLSLKDKLSFTICQTSFVEEGVFSGFDYKASCKKIKELKSYVIATDPDDPSGNIGNDLVKLFEVHLELKKDSFKAINTYYITRSEKINESF